MPATIVSLLPWSFTEKKVGLHPSEFHIPAAKEGIPGVCVIPEGVKTYIYIDSDRGSFPVKQYPDELAAAIVFDWMSAQLFYRDDAKPGVFVVPGALTGEQVLKQFPEEVEKYKKWQHKWFQTLVEQGDVEFSKYQSTRAISDTHKKAAKALGFDARWMQIENAESVQPCPACRTMISTLATVCPQCRTAVSAAKVAK